MLSRLTIRGALAGIAFAAIVALLLQLSPALFGLEWLWSDIWTRRLARERPPDPGIVIVAVNEKSLETLAPLYGRWPWTREVVARAVEEIAAGGARVVVLDILFDYDNLNDPAGDRRLAEAFAAVPVVLGAQTGGLAGAGEAPAAWRDHLWRVEGSAPPLEPQPLIAPHPLFGTAAAIGSMAFYVEPGSSIARRYATVIPLAGGGWMPSLSIAAAAEVHGAGESALWEDGVLRVGSTAIPVDERGTFAIRWHAREDARLDEIHYATVDFDRLIVASLQREEGVRPAAEIDADLAALFDGKAVIIGHTAAGLLDLRPTPLSPISAGVEIHANALENLLHGEFNRTAPAWIVVLLMFASAALFGALAAPLHSQIASTGLLALFAGAWLAAAPLALARGLIVQSVGPAIAIALTWAAITVVRFVAEQRRSSVLRATFGRYVSPQVLEYLLENPDRVDLGGERRDLTILFSDIRGFTTISESNEPEDVVEMLNDYLTRMVEILLRHGGTLDKFIGDAVMGFWNAPTEVTDHPRKAVLCAIEMIEETARLRAAWEAEGKPAIRIGIGINTGEAVVGNIGSRRVFGYTVIGDAVNLASRLEGKNKDYGTEIIVSDSTRARMGEDIPAFYLDEVRVKGKNVPVRIYEIRGSA